MIRLDIDFSVSEVSEREGEDPFTATVSAAGREIVVTVNDPSRLPGRGRRSLRELAPLAEGLARRGVTVRVDGPKGTIVAFGDVRSRVVGRVVTGSTHIRLGNVAALTALADRSGGSLGSSVAPPPPTLFPLAPTIARNVRPRVTTTHYIPGSGRPRLIFAVGSGTWGGIEPRQFELLPERTIIGSGAEAHLRLEGLAPIHAEIHHRDDDEYVLHPHERIGGGRAVEPGGPAEGARVLRTGARIELGSWRLAYVRDEFADHGRPHGGRQGGELAVQKPQPPRPYPSH